MLFCVFSNRCLIDESSNEQLACGSRLSSLISLDAPGAHCLTFPPLTSDLFANFSLLECWFGCFLLTRFVVFSGLFVAETFCAFTCSY